MTGGFYTDQRHSAVRRMACAAAIWRGKGGRSSSGLSHPGSSRFRWLSTITCRLRIKRRRFTCWKNYVPVRVKFLIAVAIIFVAAVSIISEAAFQGVVDQYDLPMDEWSVSMFVIQGAWVFIYSLMFTIIGSLPFAFWFLGPKDDRG
jgi:hypothetical protein